MIYQLKNIRNREVRLLLVVAFLFVLNLSCTKEKEPLGLDALPTPTAARMMFTDNLQLDVYSKESAAIKSMNTPLVTLGAYQDPYFGSVKHGFYTEFRLETENITLPKSSAVRIDSVHLQLVQTGVYGNLGEYTLQVYELAERLDDGVYYDSSTAKVKTSAIGQIDFTPVSTQEIANSGDGYQVKLPLDTAFGRRLIEIGSAAYESNTAFLQAINGLKVSSELKAGSSGPGGVYYFDLLSTNSNVVMYYTEIATGKSSTLSYVINDNCNYFIATDNNRSSTPVASALNDAASAKENVFIQGLGGTRAVVSMSGLDTMVGKGYIVHDAVLVCSVDNQKQGAFDPSPRLYTFGLKADGALFELPDANVRLDGELDGDDLYELRITQYVQDILDGDVENFELLVFEVDGYAARTILYGTETGGEQRLKLNLSYSSTTN